MIGYISPESRNPLFEQQGSLVSKQGESFPIENGIPRFVPAGNYAAAFGMQWNTFSKTQLDSYSGVPISRKRLEGAIGKSLDALANADVLEAGCGAGRFTELLVASGARTHAIDLSAAVDANLANIGRHDNYAIAQASIYGIPYPDNAFDLVLCLGVIQHTPSPEKTMEQLWLKVKPGGLLVFDHYRLSLSYFFKLKPLWRYFLKRTAPVKALERVKNIHKLFFPLHWKLKNYRVLRKLLYRISPLTDHLDDFPQLDYKAQSEWSLLDSYDSLTDYYKHLRTAASLRKKMESLGAENIQVVRGGTGVEVSAQKPVA